MVPEITPGTELRGSGSLGAPAALGVQLNLPNVITLARLLSVPLTIWLLFEERYAAAFWLFVAAGLSDALDGYIAKRFNRRTRLGALLDPAADKLLLAGVSVTLGIAGQLPAWLVILIVLRDFLIVLGFGLIQMTAAPKNFGPIFISKINTLVQLALVTFVLARSALGIEPGIVTMLLVLAAAVTTVLSGLSYLVRWTRILRGSGPAL